MRYVFGFLSVCALGVMPVVGCGDTNVTVYCGTDGTAGSGGFEGSGGSGGAVGDAFPCTEQGIVDAIAEGGGPHTFACGGPTTVTTEAEIVIDNDVILNGEGNLTVAGDRDHRVFWVLEGATAELSGLTVTEGVSEEGSGIWNQGSLSLTSVTVSDNASQAPGGGIRNEGTLMLTNSTVSGNSSLFTGGGIHNDNSGIMTATNSTISGNAGVAANGISNQGMLTLTNSTLSGESTNVCCAGGGLEPEGASLTISGTVIRGFCDDEVLPTLQPNGYNIESPGDTCSFDQQGDQPSVTEMQLNLGELADNGGLTMTHKPGAGGFGEGSAAIDQIPEADCGVTTDQRGEPRPGGAMCDVGSFEAQP